MKQFKASQSNLAARFVCQYWNSPVVQNLLPANTSSSNQSISQSDNFNPSGNSSDSNQNTTDSKTSDQSL